MAHMNHHSKITAQQAMEILNLYSGGGITQKALCERYGLSESQMGRIVRGHLWKSVYAAWKKKQAAAQ